MPTIRAEGPRSIRIVFEGPVDELDRLKASNIPNSRWSQRANGWLCPASFLNFTRIEKCWPNALWERDAGDMRGRAEIAHATRQQMLTSKEVDFQELEGFPFKDPQPWDHQKRALLLGRDCDEFAYLMDQGTGKTRVLLDDAAYNYMEDRIDALLVLSPNSVKTNWVAWGEVDAVDKHMAEIVPVEAAVWISQSNAEEKRYWKAFEDYLVKRAAGSDEKKLLILSVNYDAIHIPRVFDFLMAFVKQFRTMIGADESTKLKNMGSKRTKAAIKIRQECVKARIMTGTPIIKRPEDAYAQFFFLNPDILGYNSFYSFRNRYCIVETGHAAGGHSFKHVTGYKNLDELSDKIASVSYRVIKKSHPDQTGPEYCLDLPPKIYMAPRYVTMTKEQGQAYKTMLKDMYAVHESGVVEARIVLTQQMRLQEITGGYLPIIEAETGRRTGTQELVAPRKNPKFVEALEMVGGNSGQFIIWSCFTAEIDGMVSVLQEAGYRIAIFDGRANDREKLAIRKDFERGDYDGIVAIPSAGGLGVDEFKVATLSVYISNQAGDTEGRVQSEDRNHRGGMGASISYCDIMVHNSVDTKIRRMIDRDITLSQSIMKDGIKEHL
jgi:hypothetical protein